MVHPVPAYMVVTPPPHGSFPRAIRAPFSKSTIFKICRQKNALFVRTGGLSGEAYTGLTEGLFFTVFKICRLRVNAVLVSCKRNKCMMKSNAVSVISGDNE